SECAGHITAIGKGVEGFQIGDEVIAFVKDAACFSAYKTTSVSYVVPKPESLNLEEAATLPGAFMTAYHALHYLARLSKGERVLIPSAAGGVGLAAVKIAQMIGAEIFATAGNPEKRSFLHALGIEHVMNSRTLYFADEVMKCTEGKGVDVVLNSLGGIEFISTSLSLLAYAGRFLELGKRDIYENSALSLLPFQKGLSFFAIDLDHDSAHFRSLFSELIQYFKEGKLSPLPYKIFPITKVADAFKYMEKAKHIGKIVVSLQDKETLLNTLSGEALINIDDSASTHKQDVTFRHEETVAAANVNVYKENIGIKEWLLPAEGIEAFNRILHTTHSQVAVSTRSLQAQIEQNTILNFLKESASARLSGHAQSQFKQATNATQTPHNELEQAIIEVWHKFFGIENISIFDDFFELGGDSLMAVQLVAELRRSIQIELSAHSLLENRTIAALVESIQAVNDVKVGLDLQALPHSLVEIQAGNSLRQPIFLIHPIGGQIYLYRDLARRLDSEQPVYAFKAKGVDGEGQPLTQIEEMATHYLNALRMFQSDGPYILGGHSFGGLVAFEMAQQLSTLGQEVALLFMMDTVGPDQVLIDNKDSDDVRVIAYALGLDSNIDFPVPFEQFNQLPLEEQIRYFYEHSDMATQAYPSDEFISHTRHFID
ncbi:MAG: alpha/beta fold hydrolase, partial [Candidatus Parabeggiatoa sp.]|nr:alpha/beta fold hydrolase [Candidatus Parabeggiatoa sp.]